MTVLSATVYSTVYSVDGVKNNNIAKAIIHKPIQYSIIKGYEYQLLININYK